MKEKIYSTEKISLRLFRDEDITLMENWLRIPHVAKWYKHPDHWLHEIKERFGEFSFITHFIAEYENTPIGFCQYYDTYFAQAHEVWNDEWHIGERQGEIYSIDYLIGEPEFLLRGFGKRMIALLIEKIRRLEAKKIIVEPERENAASNAALETNGFERRGDVYELNLCHNNTNDLISNIDKIHTTKLGVERIKRNLNLTADDVVSWCKDTIRNSDSIISQGKNWYAYGGGNVITVNIKSLTIITAHKIKATGTI